MSKQLLSGEIGANHIGGLFDNDIVKGGIFVVGTISDRNTKINKFLRRYAADTTTLVFTKSTGELWELKNEPGTINTTDSDWKRINLGAANKVEPIGEWDAALNQVVETGATLQDTDAAGINGNFYYVTNADGGREVTYAGLFRGQTLTVYTGDYVLSVGSYFAVVTPQTTWASLDKPTVIDEYVAGTVISHTHSISNVTGLQAALDAKYGASDVADPTIDYNTVPDDKIVDVEFLRAHFYTTGEVYTQTQVDQKISDSVASAARGILGEVQDIAARDALTGGDTINGETLDTGDVIIVTVADEGARRKAYRFTGDVGDTGSAFWTFAFYPDALPSDDGTLADEDTKVSPSERAVKEYVDKKPWVENTYAALTNLYADQANQGTGRVQEVTDASADSAVVSGKAHYIYLGTTNGDLTDYEYISARSPSLSYYMQRQGARFSINTPGGTQTFAFDRTKKIRVFSLDIDQTTGTVKLNNIDELEYPYLLEVQKDIASDVTLTITTDDANKVFLNSHEEIGSEAVSKDVVLNGPSGKIFYFFIQGNGTVIGGTDSLFVIYDSWSSKAGKEFVETFDRKKEVSLSNDIGSLYKVGEGADSQDDVRIRIKDAGAGNLGFGITVQHGTLNINVYAVLFVGQADGLDDEYFEEMLGDDWIENYSGWNQVGGGTINQASGEVQTSGSGSDHFYLCLKITDADNADKLLFSLLINGTNAMADPDISTSYQPFYTDFEDHYVHTRYHPAIDLENIYRDIRINLDNSSKKYIDVEHVKYPAVAYNISFKQDATGGRQIGLGYSLDRRIVPNNDVNSETLYPLLSGKFRRLYHAVDKKLEITSVDGAVIAMNFLNRTEVVETLDTAQSAIQRDLSNAPANSIWHSNIKKTIVGPCDVTYQGAGYLFINMDNPVSPSSSLVISLTDDINTFYEIQAFVTAREDGGNKIVQITKKP